MKICWDNLERLRFNKITGNFKVNGKGSTYYYYNNCKNCNSPYIGTKHNNFCDLSCSMQGNGNPMYGRIGNNNPMWSGGYSSNNIPTFDLYAPQLEPYEQCRRNQDDPNILEVKCTYCGKWYIPSVNSVRHRIRGINEFNNRKFYCSKFCKHTCPLFSRSPNELMKRDEITAGKISPKEITREVQPQLRQMTFARDDYICVKCGSNGPLHCHHIDPVANNPIESADVDNCITLCVNCHKEAHKQDGCKYSELKCQEMTNEMVTVYL